MTDDRPSTAYMAGVDGNCPHCGRDVTFQTPENTGRGMQPQPESLFAYAEETGCTVFAARCPSRACGQLILSAHFRRVTIASGAGVPTVASNQALLWPATASRPLPPEVDDAEVRRVWAQAVGTLAISPEASAALARRGLQHVLRTQGAGKRRTLADEIDAAVDELPTDLVDELHDLREVGNFAAHPTKDTNTGEIVQVEPGEAEYTLDVLWDVVEHYFVRKKRRSAMRGRVDEMRAARGAKKRRP